MLTEGVKNAINNFNNNLNNYYCEFSGKLEFLSNFYITPIYFENILYPSSEHAFQAAKFNDIENKVTIQEALTPGKAKRLGNKLFPIRDDWELIKNYTMYQILKIKFQNKSLINKLLETGDLHLEEKNAWGDTYWGIDINTGEGSNYLGKILMQIRSELKLSKYN